MAEIQEGAVVLVRSKGNARGLVRKIVTFEYHIQLFVEGNPVGAEFVTTLADLEVDGFGTRGG